MKILNSNARQYVQNKIEFKGSHIFAESSNGVYKVYSYGYHFPIYTFKDDKWYMNVVKYSVSTSRHQSQSHPGCNCIEIDTEAMLAL